MITFSGFMYYVASILAASWVEWYHPDWRPTAWWQIPALMLLVIVWFIAGIVVNDWRKMLDDYREEKWRKAAIETANERRLARRERGLRGR